jgi:hypothetical protein
VEVEEKGWRSRVDEWLEEEACANLRSSKKRMTQKKRKQKKQKQKQKQRKDEERGN